MDYKEIKLVCKNSETFINQINLPNGSYKALIIFYGHQNVGKTKFLKGLISRLATCNNVPSKGDVRCKFSRNGNDYCICTGGDSRKVIETNCVYFEKCAQNNSQLISITAARVGSKGLSGVSDMLDYYSRKIRSDVSIVIWIKLEKLLSNCAKEIGIKGIDYSKDLKNNFKSRGKDLDKVQYKAIDTIITQLTNIETL